MKRFTKMLAVPFAVNSAAVTAKMSARRLKRPSKKEGIRIFSGRGRQGSKIVNADGYPRAARQGNGELLFLTFSALVANLKKTTLHGGQSRSWSVEQGKKKKKVWQRTPRPPRALLVRRKEKKKKRKKEKKNHAAHPHV